MALLAIEGLTVSATRSGADPVRTLDAIDLSIGEGETVGVVGETGAGKSVLLRSIMGLFGRSERLDGGKVTFAGEALPIGDDEAMREVRGPKIAVIQEGSRSRLDPVQRIGDQIADVILAHREISRPKAIAEAEELLRAVGIQDAAIRLRAYPHELSGGMCKRVVIAMALANSPRFLLADEPTAGLDVTIQIQILELFRDLIEKRGTGALVATNDLGIVAHYCDRVVVLKQGAIVEDQPVRRFFAGPERPYSRGLLRAAMAARGEAGDGSAASPRAPEPEDPAPLLEVRDLVKHFPTDAGTVHAVNGVSFEVRAGETFALIGESGSGKTTIGRCLVGLARPDAGEIRLEGTATEPGDGRLQAASNLVFQEPRESFNPRWRLGRSIEEPLVLGGELGKAERASRVRELLSLVGLPQDYSERYPHQLTAGELQRAAIARAISTNPALVVLDEPTTALDMSVRANILELLGRLQAELGTAYVFISHDMTAVKMIAHRIGIMYLGRLMELGRADDIFARQLNPYGRSLLTSVLYPELEELSDRFRLEGEIPSAINPPAGCPLSTRCPLALPACSQTLPDLEPAPLEDRRLTACIRTEEIVAAGGLEALYETDRSERPATTAIDERVP